MSEDELRRIVSAFKVLADASRLKILGILAAGPRTGGELAQLLELRASTVSHHLARLREAGLVSVEPQGSAKRYSLDETALAGLSDGLLAPDEMARVVPEAAPGTFERKVMDAFVEGTKLVKIPSSRKKRDVILAWLAEDFLVGETVSERVVNERLQAHHWDSATLRRELVGGGWFERANGQYTRMR